MDIFDRPPKESHGILYPGFSNPEVAFEGVDPAIIRKWFYTYFDTLAKTNAWIKTLLLAMPIDEIMNKHRTFTGEGWWDDEYDGLAPPYVDIIITKLPLDKYDIGVYLRCIYTCFGGMSKSKVKAVCENMTKLPKADRDRIVNHYVKLERHCLFVQSLDFKLKMNLPYDFHPHWEIPWSEYQMNDIWGDWTTRKIAGLGKHIGSGYYEYIIYELSDNDYNKEVFRIDGSTMDLPETHWSSTMCPTERCNKYCSRQK